MQREFYSDDSRISIEIAYTSLIFLLCTLDLNYKIIFILFTAEIDINLIVKLKLSF